MRSIVREFRWNSFLFLSCIWTVVPCHPDGRTSAASNFHIKDSHVQTRGIRTVDLMHAIFISDARVSGPWGPLVRTSGFELRYLPYGWARLDRNPHRPDGCSDLPITVLWKEILKLVEHWESSRRAAETSGRMQVGAVRNFSTQWKVRMESSRRSDEWCFRQMGVRTVWHVVRTADRVPNFLTRKLCRIL
jgi:hypothetical protein